MDLEDPNVDPQADDGGAVPDSGDTFGVGHGMLVFFFLFTTGLGIWLILWGRWALHHPDEIVPKGHTGGVLIVLEGAVFVAIASLGCVLLLVRMCCSCLTFDLFIQKVMMGSPRVDQEVE
jgi:hypothetical protein